MSWPLGTIPGGRVGNDVASATIGGFTFAWAGMTGGTPGGLLNVRVALRGATLAQMSRALARLEGVRVTSGPGMAGGACTIVHCAGFKMVLSAPTPGTDTAMGLVSRTVAPAVAIESPLATALDGLMRAGPRRVAPPAPHPADPPTSTLRPAPLRPGKTLARKAPLTRRTPLRRGPKADDQ
jgi:hypothetical protein